MTESENTHLSFDNLPRSVAELHEKLDRLTGMLEQIISSTAVTPSPEIMTVEDVSAMLCKSVSTIYAMTSEHRIPYRKQGNKLYFLRSEIQSWLMDAVVPKDTPKRRRKPHENILATTQLWRTITAHAQTFRRFVPSLKPAAGRCAVSSESWKN